MLLGTWHERFVWVHKLVGIATPKLIRTNTRKLKLQIRNNVGPASRLWFLYAGVYPRRVDAVGWWAVLAVSENWRFGVQKLMFRMKVHQNDSLFSWTNWTRQNDLFGKMIHAVWKNLTHQNDSSAKWFTGHQNKRISPLWCFILVNNDCILEAGS